MPDQAALARIVITDDKHRVRSRRADEITAAAEKKVALPLMARGGGALGADPNTREQRRLTRGTCPTSCILLHRQIRHLTSDMSRICQMVHVHYIPAARRHMHKYSVLTLVYVVRVRDQVGVPIQVGK